MIAHRSSHPALSQHASVGRARATARQDTLLADHHTGRTQTQSQMLSPRPVSHYREHDRDQENRGGSSRSHSGPPVGYRRSTWCRGSSVSEEGLLDDNGDGDFEEEDALLDGEGKGEAEGDMDIDAGIARAANRSSSSLSSLTKSQKQSPLKTMPLSYPALSARQYHDVHAPSINSLANVAVSARGDSGKRMPMPLPSVATMDHAHADSREYHASRGSGRASQMDELEDGFDRDADGELPERGSGGGDVDADSKGAPARATPTRRR
ncbi:hypothetical protein DFH11DRAFT_1676529 [Phellopilus nigrolimitatus]|nr:hypothetical protein DFH11DRAFT_1676529 [Phellopilus nigrolimitatus]